MPQTDSTLPGVTILETNSAGHIALGRVTGNPATLCTTTLRYAAGSDMTDTTTGLHYINIGTPASPSWRNASGYNCSNARPATIATTSTTDAYYIAEQNGILQSVDFSCVDALTQDATNYVTLSMTNLGQAGAGSTAMLAASDANTTKTTTGTAIGANTRFPLTVSATAANLVVAAGDRIRLRVTANGTSANTLTFPDWCLRFLATS